MGFIYEFLVPSSTQVDHVHYFDQCSVLLSLLWLLHSMFYEVFLCPRIHLFLSGCICLSICHIFLHIQTILDDSTSALTPKVQDSITHTFLTGSHFLQFLSLASSLTLLVGYAKGVALLLFAEANIRLYEVKHLWHNYHINFHAQLEIVVDVRRGSSSRNFPHVALVRAILTRSQHLQDRFCRQDNETTPLYQVVCLLKLHTFQIYHTLVCKASYIFYIYAWEQLSIYL